MSHYIDRTGRERIYLRRPRFPLVALPTPLYSEPFWIAYHRAMEGEPPEIGSSETAPGSISAAIVGYYKSLEFKALASTTQRTYRNTLERFRKGHANAPIAGLRPVHVNHILDSMADTPGAAAHLRKRLHSVCEYAVGAGMIVDNPVKKAKRVKYRSKGYRTWSEPDIASYRAHWSIGTPQRLAMEILLFTGLRRSDAVRIGWGSVTDGAFIVATRKSQGETVLDIPIHTELWKLIKDCPRDQATFIQTAHGTVRSDKAFTGWISESAKDAGITEQASPHGLRKAACRRLAEAGCSAHEIMAITGHRDIREIMTYTKAVEQRALAKKAMASMQGMFDIQVTNAEASLVKDIT